MSNTNLCDKDYVSVLPRIIDPKMQFTKESIENTFEKKSVNGSNILSSNNEINEKKNNIVENETNNIPKSSSFLSDYKYIILIVIIVIITIVIIYFIYRYYNNKNNKITASTNSEDGNKSKVDGIENNVNQKTIEDGTDTDKLKNDNVKSYISNYIIKEDIENDENDDNIDIDDNDNVGTDDTDIIEKDDDIFVDESYNKFEKYNQTVRNNKPKEVLLHTKIIDKPPNYIKVKQNIDISEVIDMVDNTNHSPISSSNLHVNDEKSETYSDLDDTSSKNIQDVENYDNLIYDIDDTLVYDDESNKNTYDNLINDTQDVYNNNYDSIFNDDTITNDNESDKDSDKDSDKNSDKVINISKPSKRKTKTNSSKNENTDDLTYFQKFNKSK